MTEDRTQQIEQAIAALGEQWSNRAVHAQVGGNYESLAQYLKARRAQIREEAHTAVAVAVEEEPALDPLTTPLSLARQARDQTHQAEHRLGEQEQALKQQRQALEQDGLRWEASAARQSTSSDAFDLEARRQLRALRDQLVQVESQRRAVHQQRREAAAMALEAREAYDALHGQAARWLRRLRAAQRQAGASDTARQRGDAREDLALALAELGRLVGQAEAQRCAEDATDQPDWLTG